MHCEPGAGQEKSASCFVSTTPGVHRRSHNFHAARVLLLPLFFCGIEPPSSYRGRYAARLGKHILARALSALRSVQCAHRMHTRAWEVSSTSSSDGSCHHRHCHFKGTLLDAARAWFVPVQLARSLMRILHTRESGCCSRTRGASG